MPMLVCEVQIFISSRGPLVGVALASLGGLFASSNALGLTDPLFLLGLTSCGWNPAGVRPAGAPVGCGRRRAGPHSTEQERGGKSVW
jgi:hypothetical protein